MAGMASDSRISGEDSSAQPILVPLDGSEVAEFAIPYAERIAAALQAPITYIGVTDADERNGRSVLSETTSEYLERRQRSDFEGYLEVVAGAAVERGATVATEVRGGEPYDEIIAAANRLDARMIVMATHGRGGVERWALGSVADKVMRLSGRPVLLVRPEQETGNQRHIVSLKQLLVPLDGSELAEEALGAAVELALVLDARLTLVGVEPWMTPITVPIQYVSDVTNWNEAIDTVATTYLQEARARVPDALKAEVVLLRGTPAAELEAFVAKEAVDLVIMCTHGRGGYHRALLGSVADKVVRSGTPTLLIPSFETVRSDVSPRQSMAPAGHI